MEDDDRKLCACGCGLPVRKNRGRWRRFRLGHVARLQPKGRSALRWKNGTTRQRGYVLVQMPHHPRANKNTGYVRRSIIVVEQALRRSLRPDEAVYHRNGQRNDDRLENLRVARRRAKGLTNAAITEIQQLLSRLADRPARPGPNRQPDRLSIRIIAKQFGVSNTTVVAIRDGKFRDRGAGPQDPPYVLPADASHRRDANVMA